ANDLGNLANRTLSMIHKYRGATVPAGAETALDRRAVAALDTYRGAMDGYLLHKGAAAAMALASAANGFIEEQAPWKQAKDESQAAALDATLASLARTLGRLAILLAPFMPGKMSELWEALGGADLAGHSGYASLDLAGRSVDRQAVLFPKPDK
ncbi:MAG TPA: class I tRNA ligase family protein, partial [Gemmatimonadota bacterium]|nr:class I tRNA ligase family protein [Gemmatimonadota bacterium]